MQKGDVKASPFIGLKNEFNKALLQLNDGGRN
nr:hypothetical protein [Mucilaginibacter sp. X5P1]